MKKLICLAVFVLVVINGISSVGAKTVNAGHARTVATLAAI